jgi:hypothetical protein
MSLYLDTNTDTYENTSVGSDAVKWTVRLAFAPAVSADGAIFRARSSGSGIIDVLRRSDNRIRIQLNGGSIVSTNDFTVANGDWCYLGLACTDATTTTLLYGWNAAGTRTTIYDGTGAFNTGLTRIYLGNYDPHAGNAARGYYRYLRAFGGTTGFLNTTAMETERTSPTAVQATDRLSSWKMPSEADLSDDINSKTLTVMSGKTAGTNNASEPGWISAGGSTTRGMPFGNRSTVFNGGRLLRGPIN